MLYLAQLKWIPTVSGFIHTKWLNQYNYKQNLTFNMYPIGRGCSQKIFRIFNKWCKSRSALENVSIRGIKSLTLASGHQTEKCYSETKQYKQKTTGCQNLNELMETFSNKKNKAFTEILIRRHRTWTENAIDSFARPKNKESNYAFQCTYMHYMQTLIS